MLAARLIERKFEGDVKHDVLKIVRTQSRMSNGQERIHFSISESSLEYTLFKRYIKRVAPIGGFITVGTRISDRGRVLLDKIFTDLRNSLFQQGYIVFYTNTYYSRVSGRVAEVENTATRSIIESNRGVFEITIVNRQNMAYSIQFYCPLLILLREENETGPYIPTFNLSVTPLSAIDSTTIQTLIQTSLHLGPIESVPNGSITTMHPYDGVSVLVPQQDLILQELKKSFQNAFDRLKEIYEMYQLTKYTHHAELDSSILFKSIYTTMELRLKQVLAYEPLQPGEVLTPSIALQKLNWGLQNLSLSTTLETRDSILTSRPRRTFIYAADES